MGVDEALVTEWPEQITSQIRLHMNQRVSVIVRVVQKPAMQNVLHDMIKSVRMRYHNYNYMIANMGARYFTSTQKILT